MHRLRTKPYRTATSRTIAFFWIFYRYLTLEKRYFRSEKRTVFLFLCRSACITAAKFFVFSFIANCKTKVQNKILPKFSLRKTKNVAVQYVQNVCTFTFRRGSVQNWTSYCVKKYRLETWILLNFNFKSLGINMLNRLVSVLKPEMSYWLKNLAFSGSDSAL